MAIHVTCPQCKQQVPFGRLFCTYCGAKLELTPDKVSSRVTAGEAFSAVRRWMIRLFFLAVVAGIIGVFLWPMPPQGEVGNAAQAASCERRIQSTRTRTLNGSVFLETFPEVEVNAWLRQEVAKLKDAGAGAGFQLVDINLAFKPKTVVLNTRMELSKAVLTYEVEIEPSIGSQGFQHTVRAMRVGHVPIPALATEYLAGRALHVFSGLREEGDLLRKMKQMEVVENAVRVSNQSR